jgi:hypothetical protein
VGVTDLHQIVALLQAALGVHISAGTISLNLNDGRLCSVKTETYQRIPAKGVDKGPMPAHD